MTDDTGLLPCPFCGNHAHVSEGGHKYYVACDSSDCYCAVGEAYDRDAMPEHMFYEAEAAIAAWNKRPGAAQGPRKH